MSYFLKPGFRESRRRWPNSWDGGGLQLTETEEGPDKKIRLLKQTFEIGICGLDCGPDMEEIQQAGEDETNPNFRRPVK